MDAQTKEWKRAIEDLWSAKVLDYRTAARLLAEMARHGGEPALQEAASQALPSLRTALLRTADRRNRDVARRHLGSVRDVLHTLTVPRFGKRRRVEDARTEEERHRHLLGLPLGRRLFGPEIHQAYKQAAKTVHPDAGGNGKDFQELTAARDALMKGV